MKNTRFKGVKSKFRGRNKSCISIRAKEHGKWQAIFANAALETQEVLT
jgi:hypothetical protein